MKPTKTERITKYRRPKMRTKQAAEGTRDGAAEASRLSTYPSTEQARKKVTKYKVAFSKPFYYFCI